MENKKNRVIEVIGRDPAGMYFKIVPHAKKELKKNKILNVPGGIFSLSLADSFGCCVEKIGEILDVGEVYFSQLFSQPFYIMETK